MDNDNPSKLMDNDNDMDNNKVIISQLDNLLDNPNWDMINQLG